ncbi:protease pro-enzyme activation domain-containing protein [Luteibacter aegosomatis]|uniref:protease pro-enzyme activation domain-containing protein n=1 Tax=Luteibacter aegosomatis TaxID=2911537 RepID=UPI001FF71075|nr:protease pro-enzyme activation domain-containing protein [Luteibacter aegosomatis]UPG85229.1 protease pro-enzyme activation domain-containing protein [Luteibacter aegosomatis]
MSPTMFRPWLAGAAMLVATGHAHAAVDTVGSTTTTPLLTKAVSPRQFTTLKGSVPARVATSVDAGAMGTTETIPSMTLVLKRGDDQQKRFDAYLASLDNPSSPNFHHWLTARQVGEQFGPNAKDIAAVKQWLGSQGLGVKSVSADGMLIRFTGSVGAVQQAFGTSMHRYRADGKVHFANAVEQKLPTDLVPVVRGVASLTDFFPKPQVKNARPVKRNAKGEWVAAGAPSGDFNFVYQGETMFDLVPADFATVYDVNPLWNEDTPVRGAGQNVVVLERTNVQDADVATFRQVFMPNDAKGRFTQVHPAAFAGDTSCADPGTNGDEGEAALDAEWAGAAAPDADVTLASCQDSGADFGAFLAAQNLLEQATPPPIMSLSYGECELVSAAVGDSDEATVLWSTAAAEGTTVFVSTGDAGVAGCDQNQVASSFGIAVNGLGSTPYNVAVGGTDFDDYGKTRKYWLSGNGALGASALGYIPEQTWNDSCASAQLDAILGYANPNKACNSADGQGFLNTAGGSGGPSYLWSQPSWQQGIAGIDQNVTRAIPDVSLFAANGIYGHALIFCMSDPDQGGTPCNYLDPTDSIYNSAGGTSFAAPAMAGVQALVNQAAADRLGNVGPSLYELARVQYGTVATPAAGCKATDASCVFHDVAVGDIDVPCFAGTGDCFVKKGDSYGVVSDGGRASLVTAWKAGKGYDYATGLGSVDVTHLTHAIAARQARGQRIPRTWDLLSNRDSGNPGVGLNAVLDGKSTLLLIAPKSGKTTLVQMNGSTVLSSDTWTPGQQGDFWIDGFKPGDQVKAMPYDIFDGVLTGQTVMEADNPTTHELNLAIYSYGWVDFTFPYKAGWSMVGAGRVDDSGKSQEVWINSTTGKLSFWTITCTGGIKFGRLDGLDCEQGVGKTVSAPAGFTPYLADLNGDGILDIVWTGPKRAVQYWINDGRGSFTKSDGDAAPAGFELVGAGEIAGSGKTDLIWFNAATGKLRWWTMDGTTVSSQKTMAAPDGYTLATIEDFDGDGLADLFWTNAKDDAYLWQGTGNGFLSQHVADGAGVAFKVPANFQVQTNRLQGVVDPVPPAGTVVTASIAGTH